jgi:hypothetical protein
MVMMQDALPKLKEFVALAKLRADREALVIRMVVAFVMHRGRMSAAQAAVSVRTEPRHRAQLGRFLGRRFWEFVEVLEAMRKAVLVLSAPSGTYVFAVDQTYCGQQGKRNENTLRMGRKSSRKRQCHCFVMGLLITPQGIRIPFFKCYHTKDYCRKKGETYRRQTELAADLIRELPLPTGADVVVVGDTAFDAESIQSVCEERAYSWIVPINPERVLAGPKPRPKVWSLASEFSADQFTPVRLHPGTGPYAAQRRASRYRVGPKAKPRTFYVHQERRDVHSVGRVRLVFSTRTRPQGRTVDVQKILMTNNQTLSTARIVELYDLRWQIELFFKELKSTLGMHHYRFQRFEPVWRWVELALVTFLYLEWFRARELRRRDLSREQRRFWERQRTYGLCQAVRQLAERNELQMLARHLRTSRGVRKIQSILSAACQAEYRLLC